MSNQTEQIENEIEVSIAAARDAVERKDKIERLIKNPDFKAVFEDGYFKDEAARLVGLLADPEFESEEGRNRLLDDMMGISASRRYIVTALRIGRQMEAQIAASEDALTELREGK